MEKIPLSIWKRKKTTGRLSGTKTNLAEKEPKKTGSWLNHKKNKQLEYLFYLLTAIGLLCVIIFPIPTAVGTVYNLALPPVALLVAWKYPGKNSKDVIRFAFTPVFFPPILLTFQALTIHAVHIGPLLLILALITLCCAAALLFRFPALRKISIAFVLAMILFAYFCSGVLMTNRMVTRQILAQYQPTVEQKHIKSSRRSSTCYLTLSAWGTTPDGEDIMVDFRTYGEASVHGKLLISQERGLWGIEWYRMSAEK